MSNALDQLWQTLQDRAKADPNHSYTAKLLAAGISKAAQKVGEEATETAIEAVRLEAGTGSKAKLAEESADLLYHLMVLWLAAGLNPADIYAVMEKRQGVSGIEEKNSR